MNKRSHSCAFGRQGILRSISVKALKSVRANVGPMGCYLVMYIILNTLCIPFYACYAHNLHIFAYPIHHIHHSYMHIRLL